MHIRAFATLLFALLCSVTVSAQTTADWERWFDEWCTLDDVEGQQAEAMYDVLSDLHEQPININIATVADLRSLPFLNERQVDDIAYYLYRNKQMQSIGELAMIESLDFTTRQLLACFVYIGEPQAEKSPTIGQMLSHASHELLLSADVPTYKRSGDDNGYLGGPLAHSFRYRMTAGGLRVGVIGAQQSGEPFFKHGNKLGYDYYSFYADMRLKGALKQLTLGRYRMKTGLGLVMNNYFSFGKLATLSVLDFSSQVIQPHTSRSDNQYMQGAAATIQVVKGLNVTPFVSYREIDATLDKHGNILSVLTDGYHRTQTEMDHKNRATQMVGGANIHFTRDGWHVGATATYTRYSRDLEPDPTLVYNLDKPTGRQFTQVGVDYGYVSSKVSVRGETAVDGNDVATINSVVVQPTSYVALTAVQRYFGARYCGLHATTFSEGGNVSNENGLYLGMNWQPSEHWQLLAYTDYAYFHHPRYIAYHSSSVWDNLLQAKYTSGPWHATARYRCRYRQRDNSSHKDLIHQTEHRVRMAVGWQNERWQCNTQADVVHSRYEDRSTGWMLSEVVAVNLGTRAQLSASAAYFNTDDYESRLYVQETGLWYRFAYRAFYGEGVRCTMALRATLSTQLSALVRVAWVKYMDRSVIGTGLQQIDGSSATDIQAQIRWRF